jgi:Holliday junction resolvasome RuvABC endonuclease subunit
MATIVGLDLSLVRTGIAVLTDGRPTLVRSVGHAGVSGANYRDRSRRITSQCSAVCDALKGQQSPFLTARSIDLAVIEDQLAHGPMLPSALDRSAMWWGVYSALASRGIPVVVVNPMTLKVWTTGKGRADKADMLAAVREWGWAPANHDEADALSLASIGAFHCGDPVPFKTKDRHAATLEKVAMPTIGVGA